MDTTLLKLVNSEFDFEFMGKTHRLRQASLDKLIQYQRKAVELKDKDSADYELVAFAIYLMLKDKEPELTHEKVIENTPASIDVLEVLIMLGFIDPRKLEFLRKMQQGQLNNKTTPNSSAS